MNSKSILNTVDIIRLEADTKLNESRRGAMGQYMTPSPLAELISSMFNDFSGKLQLLDAGAGVGSLTASFSDRATEDVNCTNLSVQTYELDDTLSLYLSDTIEHIKTAFENTKINFTATIYKTDFIHAAVSQLKEMQNGKTLPAFNRVILNPPYVKISAHSQERKLLREVGVETGNLYSAFVALSLLLMSDDGELVAITPRSFCNGPHFKNIRDILLDGNYLSKIHIFESRKLAFKDNNVLQENLIFHVIKGKTQGPVTITSSSSSDTKISSTRIADFSEVVNINDPAKFIRIITNDKQADIAEKVAALPSTLDELGVNVSTGKVVDFRTKPNLSLAPVPDSVPLIYPQHFLNAKINWPKPDAKKPNALLLNLSTEGLVVQNGVYVLTKRFSSKEEKRRISAAIYLPTNTKTKFIGFDNKLNYFHNDGLPLDPNIARGLTVFLNTTFIDQFFRQFSGHTQVNVSDLKSLRYPNLSQLSSLAEIPDSDFSSQTHIDSYVEKVIFGEM